MNFNARLWIIAYYSLNILDNFQNFDFFDIRSKWLKNEFKIEHIDLFAANFEKFSWH